MIVRGEILGFVKDEPLRKHLPRMFSLIQNEDRQKSPVDQKGKSLLDIHNFIASAVRESICDVVLSSTRQHDDHVDASTQEHREQLSNQLFIGSLC